MQVQLSIEEPLQPEQDVLVIAPPGASWSEVRSRLVDQTYASLTPQLWCESIPVDEHTLVGEVPLVGGARLSTTPRHPPPTGAGAARLDVIGGPDAGRSYPLHRGVLTIGRAPDCDISLSDAELSRHHATLTVRPNATVVRDDGTTNGTWLDGELVTPTGSAIGLDQVLRVGSSLLTISSVDEPLAAIVTRPDGRQVVPRPMPAAESPGPSVATARWWSGSPGGGPSTLPWLAAAVPAASGIALAVEMHSLLFLALVVISPLAIVVTAAVDRWRGRRGRRRPVHPGKRRARLADQQRLIALAGEGAERRRRDPDPAALLRTAVSRDRRLWERRLDGIEGLSVRLGLGASPSEHAMPLEADSVPLGTVAQVPISVTLSDGPLVLRGARRPVTAVARWLVAQLAVRYAPSDVQIVLLLDGRSAADWRWARWLPHLRGRVALAAAERHRALEDVRAAGPGNEAEAHRRSAWTVVVCDQPLGALDAGLAELLHGDSPHRTTAIWLDGERSSVTTPGAIASVSGETATALIITSGSASTSVVADQVSVGWADRVSRALAPLVEDEALSRTSPQLGSRDESVGLVDLLSLSSSWTAALRSRWTQDGRPVAVLGTSPAGPVYVDLVRDGPHALVAGTTGSGKSELLQVLVASLAAARGPDDVTFLLIDYKGGAAFAECARLPHTVALLTDLDPALTSRALRSLQAELRRRERLLASAECADVSQYRRATGREPIARLVIVVDEFAGLADELPDFVAGLIGVAQRGRSLGVHLVLATQRPGGAVSPEIRANAALRIVLRVLEPAESTDLVGVPDAARFVAGRPGSALILTAVGVTGMRTARVSCRREVVDRVQVISLDEWGRRPSPSTEPVAGPTDLSELVAAARDTAAEMRLPGPRPLWAPPLPVRLTTSALVGPAQPLQVPIGLIDVPDAQRQDPLTIDIGVGGSVLVVGGPRSGRSTVLRTIALEAARRSPPASLHVYAIDSGGSLRDLSQLPHCGTVAGPDEPRVTRRLLRRLSSSLIRRLDRSAVGGAAMSHPATPDPSVLVLIDGWEQLSRLSEEHDGGASTDLLVRIMRDGPAVGFTVVVTGDRTTLSSRVAGVAATKFVLRLADRGDFALAGLDFRRVPSALPPGRAIRTEDAAEVQFSLPPEWDSDEISRIGPGGTAVAAELPARATSTRGPIVLRRLPPRVRSADLNERPGAGLLLGIGGDDAAPISVLPFAGAARLLITGAPTSGRSTALCMLLAQTRQCGVDVAVIGPPRSPLITAAATVSVPAFTPNDHAELESVAHRAALLWLVDDLDRWRDTDLAERFAAMIASRGGEVAVVAATSAQEAATAFRGITADVRRGGRGLLLQPGPHDGDALGVRLPPGRLPGLPGRGFLVGEVALNADEPIEIQVALPGEPE